MVKTMTEYDFELNFQLPDEQPDPESHLDALFESGCNDAIIGTGRHGYIGLDFSREANTAETALISAVEDILHAIPGAILVSASPDLVNLSDVPKLMAKLGIGDLTRQAMRKYAFGEIKKSLRPFPSGAFFIGSSPLWHLNEVIRWMLDHNKIEKQQSAQALLEVTNSIRQLNASLEHTRNRAPTFDELAERIAN